MIGMDAGSKASEHDEERKTCQKMDGWIPGSLSLCKDFWFPAFTHPCLSSHLFFLRVWFYLQEQPH